MISRSECLKCGKEPGDSDPTRALTSNPPQTKVEKQVHIVLSEREAEWLRSFVQNYPGQGEEPSDQYDMRKALFDALTPNAGLDGRRERKP